MFGMMEALLSFIRRQVGLRTDAASASGSLHAKVKDLKTTIFAWHQKTPTFSKGSVTSCAAASTVDVLNVTGNRVTLGGSFFCSAVGSSYIQARIIADGVEILPWTVVSESLMADNYGGIGKMPLLQKIDTSSGAALQMYFYFPIPTGFHFTTSFIFQVKNTDDNAISSLECAASLWHVPA